MSAEEVTGKINATNVANQVTLKKNALKSRSLILNNIECLEMLCLSLVTEDKGVKVQEAMIEVTDITETTLIDDKINDLTLGIEEEGQEVMIGREGMTAEIEKIAEIEKTHTDQTTTEDQMKRGDHPPPEETTETKETTNHQKEEGAIRTTEQTIRDHLTMTEEIEIEKIILLETMTIQKTTDIEMRIDHQGMMTRRMAPQEDEN
jgi:hypothetical protein